MNTDKILEKLDQVSLSKIEAAIGSIKKHYPDKNSDDINVTFEFLIGSFYPNILNNIKKALTESYINGYNEGARAE